MTHDEGSEPSLTIQVGGGDGEPERLLIVGRPADGRVSVREWVGAGFGGAPLEREMEARELLAQLERAVSQRRQVSEELYRIRDWFGAR